MKTYYIAVLLMLAGSVQAQGVKVKVIDATGIERWIDYVPGVTSVPTNIKPQLDSMNTSLRSYIQASLTNYQNWVVGELAKKANIGSTTGTGGSPYGNIINLPADTWISEIRPFNYGVTYNNGKQQQAFFGQGYEHAPGINFSSNRPNIIYQVAAYNSTPKGNRISNLDGFWSKRVETEYDISGQLLNVFEPHIFEWGDYAGNKYRAMSGYFSKVNGRGFWNFTADYLAFFYQDQGKQPVEYASITRGGLLTLSQAQGAGAGIRVLNPDGSIGMQLYNAGGINTFKIPGVIDADGYGNLTLSAPNNPTGRKAGQSYWKTVVINGETLEVLVRVK